MLYSICLYSEHTVMDVASNLPMLM